MTCGIDPGEQTLFAALTLVLAATEQAILTLDGSSATPDEETRTILAESCERLYTVLQSDRFATLCRGHAQKA
jgi:hypothetical protein